MTTPSNQTIAVAMLMSLLVSGPVDAATVTGAGYTSSFAVLPPASDWSTYSIPGATADIDSAAALDAAVQNVSATSITAAATADPTDPPPILANAAWSSTGLYLQTRPTGNGATALMCTLVNGLGADASAVSISYDFASAVPAAESVSGHRAYYSLTGAAGSWLVIPEFSSAAPGRLTANISMTWPNGGNLYLLWADENGAPSPDAGSQIDNFSATATPATHVPASITAQPQSRTVGELQPVSFSVTVAGNPVPALQWYTNGVAVAGATSSTLSFASTPLHYGGLAFRVVAQNIASNVSYSVTSAVATLTVNADTVRPVLLGAGPSGLNLVVASFSERLAPASVANVANYSVAGAAGGLTISNAVLDASQTNLILTVSTMAPGSNYVLTVSGVTDQSAAANIVQPNSQAAFTSALTTFANVGNPATPGSSTAVAGGFNVTGAGNDIGGTNDQFSFSYQMFTGDFDVKVRVDSLSVADAWAKAGLMVRENLSGGSRYAAAFATPGIAGSFFQFRTVTVGQTTNAGSFPSTYPNAWLRLRRQGSTFTGFAGVDGNTWVQLGSMSMNAPALPSTLLVGLAVTSRSASQGVTAGFRGMDNITGTPEVRGVTLNREPLGPSSRRTGMVISEIMYHPISNALEFIEIFNAQPFDENLSGWRLSDAIDYTFPEGTSVAPGHYLVVARNPSALQAVSGVSGILGPWRGQSVSAPGSSTNGLPDNEGVVRLRNKTGAVLLEIEYQGARPWPIAADGSGHSLVLSRPSYGEADPRAWSASERIGGSPGMAEPFLNDPLDAVVINEFLANTGGPDLDFVELYNHSSQPVDISGAFLSDDRDTNKFRIPAGTVLPARGFISFDQSQLGFALSSGGERIYFVNPGGTRVIDTVAFDAQAAGISSGRHPDGAPAFHELATRTPGSANAALLIRDVVINEIMYNPISGDQDDEYLELFNRGATAADVGNWRLVAGIDYRIPAGTVIPAGGYLVVAKNATNLIAIHSHLNATNTVGDFGGTLANGGERVALAMPEYFLVTNANNVVSTQANFVVVDEIVYDDGGRWGEWADGGGSSLELVDPSSDNRHASNWADSDETLKAPWTVVENVGGGVDNGSGAFNEVHLMILGRGECLVDDIEVRNGLAGANIVTNPGFDNGFTTWLAQGNHVRSSLEPSGPGNPSPSMRIRASAGGDNGFNRVEADLGTPAPSGSATLRAKFRWLRGHPDVLLRVHGNWLEAPARLSVPKNLGTPGLVNSRRISNAGPAITDVTHTPVLPSINETITVTARVGDPDGLGAVNLRYRIDPASTVTTVAMNDNGLAGDAVAGDGIYSGQIPGRATATLIGFHITATDLRAGGAAGSTFPANLVLPPAVPSVECMIRVGETGQPGSFGTYRLWMSAASISLWQTREQLSNEALDGTFVYNNSRVIYNGGARYRGSPFIRPNYTNPLSGNVAYVWTLPNDDLFLGADELNLDSLEPTTGTGNTRDATVLREPTSFWMAGELGISFSHQRFVHVHMNGVTSASRGIPVYADTQQPDGDYIESWFPEDPDGEIFKIDDWFEYSDVTQGNAREFNVDATLGSFNTTNLTSGGLVRDQGRYRWSWEKKFNGGLNDDYSTLFSIVDAINAPTNQLVNAFTSVVDEESWMTAFMLRHAVGDWDGYGYRRGKNQFFYKPQNDRAKMLLWDLDFSLGCTSGDGPTTGMFDSGQYNDALIFRLISQPYMRRVCLRAIQRMVDGPFNLANVTPIIDQRYNAFQRNGVVTTSPHVASGAQSTSITNWIRQRRDNLLTLLPNAPFSINPTNATNGNLITLTGTAPVLVKDILMNGQRWAVTWTTITTWTARVVMEGGANRFDFVGVGLDGSVITSTQSVTGVYSGPTALPQDSLVFSEIMYNPVVPQAAFVEIHNRGQQAFDLSNWRVNGLDYTFPVGSVIASGQYLVLAKNPSAFAAAFGTNATAFGRFDGNLDLDGETLALIKPGLAGAAETIVDRVRYEPRAPWPTGPNGSGSSLQLVDVAEDNSRPSNWSDRLGWRQAVYTGTIQGTGTNNTPAGTNFLVFLNTAGDVYIDDIEIVTGLQPGNGPNLVSNGGFESPLAGSWTILGNHSNSVISTEFSRSGSASLRIVAGGVGGASSALRQFIPALPSNSVCTLSYWYLPSVNGSNLTMRTTPGSLFVQTSTFRPTFFTPGAGNSVEGDLPAYAAVWLNELQAENTSGPTDNAGERDPWIELFNAGTTAVDLSGYYLANNYNSNLTQWAFPAGSSIAAGEYKLVWADGQPAQTAGAFLHTSFRLNAATGSVALVRLVDGLPQVTDYLTYGGLPAGYSYGDFPDGQPFNRVNMPDVTPGTTNIARPVTVFINEWLAGNTNTIADPVDGQFEDWFELHNPGTNSVDLGGFWLTDSPGNAGNYFQIPANGHYTIAPGGFLLVWADNEPGQNSAARPDLHVDFQLGKGGESIALYAPDKRTLVDRVTFAAQVDDISEGRFPDSAPFISVLTAPTPRTANQLGGGNNTPPTLDPISSRTIRLGQTISFTATADDVDVPAQTLAFDLPSGAPTGVSFNPAGQFSWTPGDAQAPSTNSITIRVTDNGVPAQSASRTFTVVVLLPPLAAISRDGNNVALTFDTTAGRTYQVQFKNNLNDAQWQPVSAPVVAAGPTLGITDSITARPQRFYRIIQLD